MSEKKTPAPRAAQPKAPRESAVRPTLKAWLTQEGNQVRLQEILHDPVFLAAAHYVEQDHALKSRDLFEREALADTAIIRKAAFHAGLMQFVNNLKYLATTRADGSQLPVQEWEHILPNHK